MPNVPLSGMNSYQFQQALQQFSQTLKTSKAKDSMQRDFLRFLLGKENTKFEWVIRGDIDKFESLEEAVEYQKYFEELMAQDRTKRLIQSVLGCYYPEGEDKNG